MRELSESLGTSVLWIIESIVFCKFQSFESWMNARGYILIEKTFFHSIYRKRQ